MHSDKIPLILASESPSRLEILTTCHLPPDLVIPANIDESPLKHELPWALALRLSEQKAEVVAAKVTQGYIIGADSVVVTGRSVLPKAINDELVAQSLRRLSGKRHRVITAVTVIKKVAGTIVARKQRVVTTIIKFKRLTEEEINFYVTSREGLNKAGGYAIQGLAQVFTNFISGSVANIIGLPSFELEGMLRYLGYQRE